MHMLVHSGERPYQCHLCGKTFRTQGKALFEYMQCIVFKSMLLTVFEDCLWFGDCLGTLDKHNRTHTGERPFSCEFCEQRFTEKGALVRHIASKHQEGRPHSCHICGKTFKGKLLYIMFGIIVKYCYNHNHYFLLPLAREQLRVHLNRHKGMRKFECIDCGYKFTRQVRFGHTWIPFFFPTHSDYNVMFTSFPGSLAPSRFSAQAH